MSIKNASISIDALPQFLRETKKHWYRKDMQYKGMTECWFGRVKMNQARAKDLLDYFGKASFDRDMKNENLLAMEEDMKNGNFVHSNVMLRFVICENEGGKMKRGDGQHYLHLMAKLVLNYEPDVCIQICSAPNEKVFRKFMLSTELRSCRTGLENSKTGLEGNSEFEGIPKRNLLKINEGYHAYMAAFENKISGDKKKVDKKHSVLSLMDNPKIAHAINKYIGSVGSVSCPVKHLHRSSPIAVGIWVLKNDPHEFDRFMTAISTGPVTEGVPIGDGLYAYRDLLLSFNDINRGIKKKNQTTTRHNYSVRAGLYGYALHKVNSSKIKHNICRSHLCNFVEATTSYKSPTLLVEALSKQIASGKVTIIKTAPKRANSIKNDEDDE